MRTRIALVLCLACGSNPAEPRCDQHIALSLGVNAEVALALQDVSLSFPSGVRRFGVNAPVILTFTSETVATLQDGARSASLGVRFGSCVFTPLGGEPVGTLSLLQPVTIDPCTLSFEGRDCRATELEYSTVVVNLGGSVSAATPASVRMKLVESVVYVTVNGILVHPRLGGT